MQDQESQVLQNDFEESYFAILMGEFAKVNGERLLAENKRLATKPLSLPAEMDKRITNAIHREYANLRWKKIGRYGKRMLSRAAMIVLVIMATFSMLCVSSSAFREKILNLVTEWHERYTSIRYGEEDLIGAGPHLPSWLPDGFTASYISDDGNLMIYENHTCELICIQIGDESYSENIDTENASPKDHYVILGFDSIALIKDEKYQVTIADTINDKIVTITCPIKYADIIELLFESMYTKG